MKFEKPKDADLVGEGGYKRAFYSETESPDKIWVEFKASYTPEQARSIYYLNNIINILFPEHTVRISQSGVDKENRAYLSSDFMSHESDDLHKAIQKETLSNGGQPFEDSSGFDKRSDEMDDSEEVQAFLDKYEEAGLMENFASIHMWGPQDLIFDENNNFKFVDVDPAWEEPEDLGEQGYTNECLRFSPKKLQLAIDNIEIDYEKENAQKLYNRLLDLCREVGFDV